MSNTFKDKWLRKYNHTETKKIKDWKVRLSLRKIYRRHNNSLGEYKNLRNIMKEKILYKDMNEEKNGI